LQRAISIATQPSIAPLLLEALHCHAQQYLQQTSTGDDELATFARGQGLLAYTQLAGQTKQLDPSLWVGICKWGPECCNVTPFLEATLAYISAVAELPECPETVLESFATSLLLNLSSPSHQIRLLSLKILQELLRRAGFRDSIASTAIEIEESELTLQTARMMSMEIRKLAQMYPEVSAKKWLDRLIPYFCFGLLSKKLSSMWEDACSAIKVVCEYPAGEKVVSELATRWMLEPALPATTETDAADQDATQPGVSSEFECFNVVHVERSILSSFSEIRSSDSVLVRNFESANRPKDAIPSRARSQALRVLNAVPHLAEKKSRQLVPLFLEWALQDEENPTAPESELQESPGTENGSAGWNFRDKKDILALFGKFQNPKVIYKSSEVHDSLTGLLCNGDSEVQKLALKALLTWKMPFMVPYQENLLNIIDDARFRDELAVFVHVGQENSVIKEDHRPELLPYVLRLLYGKAVSRGGSKGALGSQEARRKTILRTISQLPEDDFDQFIQIAYGILNNLRVIPETSDSEDCLSREFLSPRKQYGLLKMIESMFSILKSRMSTYSDRSMNVVLYCLIRACRQLTNSDTTAQGETAQNFHVTMTRNVRTVGIRCLDLVFSVSPDVDWQPYVPLILTNVIGPRLEKFAVETAQGVSGILQLFRTWAAHPRSAHYLVGDSILPRVVDCLNVDSARDEVKLFVIDEVLGGLIKSATKPETDQDGDVNMELSDSVRANVLAPHLELMLTRLESLLRSQLKKPLTMSAVDVLSKLAAFVESSGETTRLISTATYLLQQGHDRVPPKTKGGLLRVMQHFLPLYNAQENSDLTEEVFEVLSSLFDYFKDDPNRNTLSCVFESFANHDVDLSYVASLCADLNSLSSKRLDEVDFERRLAAFSAINEQKYESFSAKQWRPLVLNLLYHVKDVEELAIRSSSSLGLKRFILSAETKAKNGDSEFRQMLDKVVLPALRTGVKHPAETVRAELVGVLGYLIQHHPDPAPVQDMFDLLANGDEEASFFNNILHIQQHRRLRALRRLAGEAGKGKLKPSNISSLFFPLIEHFVFSQAEDENAHNLAAETVSTLGALSQWLEWSQFRAIFRRYKAYMESKPGMERNVIRLLGQMTNALSAAAKIKDVKDEQTMELAETELAETTLSRSLPSKAQIATELKTNFIASFAGFIRRKEETEVSLRLPLAVTTVKLLQLLPADDMALLLPPVLLDISNVLRSRSQETRDVARKTLGDIALILGPTYLGYILGELRTALARGYQLHVLSFTVHSILVTTADEFKPGELDQSLEALVSVVMDDIFGTVGQEKDAEEYVSKMKEVKSSKSYDSMELLAKNASIKQLSKLIQPIQQLLQEKLTANLIRKIDELLRRIGLGILRNPGSESRDLLVFCYEVIKESYVTEASVPRDKDWRAKNRYLVDLQGQKKSGTGRSTSSYLHRLTRFGLDALRSVLNKHSSLQTPQNLQGFLPLIGDALVQGYEEVKLSAIRLLGTIAKLPLPDLDKHADVYLVEAIKLIREASGMNTEAAQVSLKFIASILRERKATKIKDSYLSYLLKRVSSDVEDPDRQGVTFNFIRAVMARKFIVPEMYELVDNIAAMMVTNQTRSARDLARGIYIHFLVEYPQAKSRWTKQLAFMAKNLDYKHKEGRQSVMEAVHLLLSKTGGDLAQDIVDTFFVPVILAMANDEATECREMAGALLGDLFGRADSDHLKSILAILRTWVEQQENPVLTVAGLQAVRIFFEADAQGKESEVQFVIGVLPRLLATSLDSEDDNAWQLLFQSLQLFSKLTKLFPALTLTAECKEIWSQVQRSLLYPHPWIKSCSANLVGTWFAEVAKTNAANGYGSVPLQGAFGLKLDSTTMLDITRASMFCLKSPVISEDLATQVVRNLVFLGRCFGQNNLEFSRKEAEKRRDGELSDASDVESDAETPPAPVKGDKPAIQYILEQAARILRREPLSMRAESLNAKAACMKLVAALCNHLETAQITPLQSILLPLLHLTDPSIPAPHSSDEAFESTYKSLVQSSQEILDLLQKKMGTSDFVAQISEARETMRTKREERRVKRRIEAVTDPAKAGLEKRRKHDRKRERRKERGHEFRGKRRGW
jgi:U3 small nucleolar RNA-associated protein 20